MSAALIKEIVTLLNNNFRPYNGQPISLIYEKLACKMYKRKPPSWFVKGDAYVCLGCARRCTLSRPEGFQLLLPINYPSKLVMAFTLTPEEMVKRKNTLTMNEVCYCLNVSYSKAYTWVQEGKLIALKEKPLRVRASDVEAMMNDYDE